MGGTGAVYSQSRGVSGGTSSTSAASNVGSEPRVAAQSGMSQSAAYAAVPAAPAGRELWDPQRGPQSTDVAQGNTGDCWLMGELASLAAKSPDSIRNMVHEDANGQGATVTLHQLDGNAVQEHVKLPANGVANNAPGIYQSAPDARQPVGADGKQHTWVSYIEAAVGQYIGQHAGQNDPNSLRTQDGLRAGSTQRAGAVLTGQGSTLYALTSDPSDLESAWQGMRGADAGRVVTAATQPPGKNPVLPSGIEAGHIYSVLGTEQDAQGNRFVLARDPKAGRSGATAYDVAGKPGVKRIPLAEFAQSFCQVQVLGTT